MLSHQFSNLTRQGKLKRLRVIAATALKRYAVDVSRFRFYAEHSNVLYLVDTSAGDRYLLKVARPGDHSMEEILASLGWLYDANLAGVPNLMEVVPAQDGELAVTVEEPAVPDLRFCSLYRWVPGRNLEGRVTARTAWKWGALSASLHRFSHDYTVRPDSQFMTWDKVFYWDEEVLFDEEYRAIVNDRRRTVFRRAADRIQARMDALYASGAPILIHADLHPDNIRINSGRLWALDVEDLMWGYPQQDIAISLMYIRQRPDFSRLCSSFREGYSTVTKWPVTDPDELNTYFAARILMFANFIVKLTDLDEDRSDMLDRYAARCTEYLGEQN